MTEPTRPDVVPRLLHLTEVLPDDYAELCLDAAVEIERLRVIVRALHARTGLDDRPYPWTDGDQTSLTFRRAFQQRRREDRP